jgi:hypothetical protein
VVGAATAAGGAAATLVLTRLPPGKEVRAAAGEAAKGMFGPAGGTTLVARDLLALDIGRRVVE